MTHWRDLGPLTQRRGQSRWKGHYQEGGGVMGLDKQEDYYHVIPGMKEAMERLDKVRSISIDGKGSKGHGEAGEESGLEESGGF